MPEDCSGEGCHGFGVGFMNHPVIEFQAFSHFVEVGEMLAYISIVRPASFYADFYFTGDRLDDVLVTYESEGARVGFNRIRGLGTMRIRSAWMTDAQGRVQAISVLSEEEGGRRPPDLASALDLGCFHRVLGCRTALQLWPQAPPATVVKPVDGLRAVN